MNKKLMLLIIFVFLIIISISSAIVFKQNRLIKSITLEKTRLEQINSKSSSCLYDTGEVECSCDIKSENEVCLAKLPEGEIIGRYVLPYQGKIIVKSSKGQTVEADASFGFDQIFKNRYGGYYIFSTTREYDNRADFDRLLLVNFYPNPPLITIISDQSSNAAYDENADRWFLVPLKRQNKDLVLQKVSNTGEIIDEFNFGQKLQQITDIDSNFFVNQIQLISNDDVLISFGRIGENKGVVSRRYILSSITKTIKREVPL